MKNLFKIFVGMVIAVVVISIAFTVATSVVEAGTSEHCPDGGTKYESSSDNVTLNGVNVSWSGSEVWVSGGEAQICVKASTQSSGDFWLSGYWVVDWVNDGGQTPDISYLVIYDVRPEVPPTPTFIPPTNTPVPNPTEPGQEKIRICHFTSESAAHQWQAIEIAAPAWEQHQLNHPKDFLWEGPDEIWPLPPGNDGITPADAWCYGEPGPTPTEPGPTPTEPGPTPTEPGPTPTEPGPTPTEPVPTPTEPVPTPTEPVVPTEQPTNVPTEVTLVTPQQTPIKVTESAPNTGVSLPMWPFFGALSLIGAAIVFLTNKKH